MTVTKAAPIGVFGYAAGKSRIARQLASLITTHKTYVEPFCGSAAVFFAKDASSSELEVLGDVNRELVAALKTIRGLSKSEIVELEARDWTGKRETFDTIVKSLPSASARIDRLYKFLYLVNFSFAKGMTNFNPDREGVVSRMMKRVAKFQPRLAQAKIVADDYAKVVKEHDSPETFFFLDPPYVGYSATGGNVGEKSFNETEFRKVLEGIEGRFLLTYGTKGGLDTSGFHVKRMQHYRDMQTTGATGEPLTHLLVSNFAITEKSLDGIDLDDVVGIIDQGSNGEHMMVSSGATISVPEALTKRAFENVDVLLEYPAEKGGSVAKLAIVEAGGELYATLSFEVNKREVDWTMKVQRAPLVGDIATIAKTFTIAGTRFFEGMTAGVNAIEGAIDGAVELHKLEATIEHGLQSLDAHEYFLSKGGELTGALRFERDPSASLGSMYPWIATFIDSKFIPNAILSKASSMPPAGVSALPAAVERFVPSAWQYWREGAPEVARKMRDAFVLQKSSGSLPFVAHVDGELVPIVVKYELAEMTDIPDAVADWPMREIGKLAGTEIKLVEFFSPAELSKLDGDVAFCDAVDGDLSAITKALATHPGDYAITALDTHAARAALEPLGRVFKFASAPGVGLDAVDRIFVASFGIRSDAISYVAKSVDVRHMLETIGPPNEWSGGVAGALGPDRRAAMKEAWDAMSATERGSTLEAFHRNFSIKEAFKEATYSKGDMANGGPGTLVPAVGNPEDDDKHRSMFALSLKIAKGVRKDGEERYAFGIVLEPDTVDAQQDVYSAEEVRAAAHTYMEQFQNTGLMHEAIVNDQVKVLESYVAPVEFDVGDQHVKAGTWLMAVRVLDEKLWGEIKNGSLTGFSIGGTAQRAPDPVADKKHKADMAIARKAMKTIDFQGITLKIDRPAGTVQSGKDANGVDWSRTYKLDYGYIPRTQGGDGDGIDVFIGPNASAPNAYWVVQKKPDGSFDEYKIMVGFDSATEAKKAYADHVPMKFFGSMREMSVEQMKALLNKEPSESVS